MESTTTLIFSKDCCGTQRCMIKSTTAKLPKNLCKNCVYCINLVGPLLIYSVPNKSNANRNFIYIFLIIHRWPLQYKTRSKNLLHFIPSIFLIPDLNFTKTFYTQLTETPCCYMTYMMATAWWTIHTNGMTELQVCDVSDASLY